MQVTSLSFFLSFFPRASRLLRKSRKSAHRHGGGLVGGGECATVHKETRGS